MQLRDVHRFLTDQSFQDTANGNIYSEADEEAFYASILHDQHSRAVDLSRVRQNGQGTGLLSISRAQPDLDGDLKASSKEQSS